MKDSLPIGRQVLRFRSLNSTQDVAIELAEKGEPEGLVVLAEEQTKGRGRWGRNWFSLPTKALMFSFLLRPRLPLKFAPYLSLFSALACAQAIEGIDVKCGFKWPNDILIGHKKAGGILVEMKNEGEEIRWAVIGIGLNVNFEEADFPEELREIATSLRLALGKSIDIEVFFKDILKELNEKYPLCFSEGGREKLKEMWIERDTLKGKAVEVQLGKGNIIRGIEEGIDGEGFLKVRVGDELVRISAGDVYFLKDEN